MRGVYGRSVIKLLTTLRPPTRFSSLPQGPASMVWCGLSSPLGKPTSSHEPCFVQGTSKKSVFLQGLFFFWN